MAELTRQEIKRRLNILSRYELTVYGAYRWEGEDPDAVDSEIDRVRRQQAALRAALAALPAEDEA